MLKFGIVVSAVLAYAVMRVEGVSVTEKADLLVSRMLQSIDEKGDKYFRPKGYNFSEETAIVTATPLPGFTMTGLKRSGEATLKLEDFDNFYIHVPYTFGNISTFFFVNFTFLQDKELSYSSKVQVVSNSVTEGHMRIELDDAQCKGILMEMDLGGFLTQSYKVNGTNEESESFNRIKTTVESTDSIDYAADMQRAIFTLVEETINDVLDKLYMCDITV